MKLTSFEVMSLYLGSLRLRPTSMYSVLVGEGPAVVALYAGRGLKHTE